jgi:hypothetical protein
MTRDVEFGSTSPNLHFNRQASGWFRLRIIFAHGSRQDGHQRRDRDNC